jgi:thiamine biosynthesis protein ThiI
MNQKCSVVFTGESLGQVASQTPENLAAEEHMVRIPVLRPLIGFDKEEIISVARRIGTYSYSILPYKDVCSINARNPKIKADARIVADISKEIKIKSIVSRSLKLSSSFST